MEVPGAETERLKAEGTERKAARPSCFQTEIALTKLERLGKFQIETIFDVDREGKLLIKWTKWDSKFNT
ncbi:hypothetical protein AAVH_25968 [Aphelenchoides avenae]|nr:hypothetical protein AAVH_25968 [Aphelenchus avenae]